MMFEKNPALIVRRESPFNGGPPPELVRRSYITPADLFFVRSHGNVPAVDGSRFRLSVGGTVHKSLSLSLTDLRECFPKTTVVAALQCAGNRRKELMKVAEIRGEVPWDSEAISNAEWGGVSLRLILRVAGILPEAEHIAFTGLDQVEISGGMGTFGGSIPRQKAMSPEVIVAYEMNGRPLPPVHGFPLRVVVPGYIGARSIKWLGAIVAQPLPSDNYFQAHAYKLYSPWVSAEDAHLHSGWPLGEQRVSSCICRPLDGEMVASGPVLLQGYAISGGGKEIERVELSADGGRNWTPARITEYRKPWGWCFWDARLNIGPGSHEVSVRAWDSAGETQPKEAADVWNFKGYMNSSWHRIQVHGYHTASLRPPINRAAMEIARP
jgi:sulfite oxidase